MKFGSLTFAALMALSSPLFAQGKKDEEFSGVLTMVSGDWDFLENTVDAWSELDGITVQDMAEFELIRTVLGTKPRGCPMYSIDAEFVRTLLGLDKKKDLKLEVELGPIKLSVEAGFGSLSELEGYDDPTTKMECMGPENGGLGCNYDLKSDASVKVNMKKWIDFDFEGYPDIAQAIDNALNGGPDTPPAGLEELVQQILAAFAEAPLPIDDNVFTMYGAMFLMQCPVANYYSLLEETRQLAQVKNVPWTEDSDRRLKELFDKSQEAKAKDELERSRNLMAHKADGRDLLQIPEDYVGLGADVDYTPEFVFSCPKWQYDSILSSSTAFTAPASIVTSIPFCPDFDLFTMASAVLTKPNYYGGIGSPVTHVEKLKTMGPSSVCGPDVAPTQNANALGFGRASLVIVGCGLSFFPTLPPPPTLPPTVSP